MVASGHRFISRRFRVGADVDDLWQTVQPGPFSESQAQQLQAAALISSCWGNRMD